MSDRDISLQEDTSSHQNHLLPDLNLLYPLLAVDQIRNSLLHYPSGEDDVTSQK